MNLDDFDLSWLPEKPDEETKGRAKVALAREAAVQLGSQLNDTERMLCNVASAEQIELHIELVRLRCELVLKMGRRRHLKERSD